MKKIVYTRPDGGISVVHPAPNDRREIWQDGKKVRDETEDEQIARILPRVVPAGATNMHLIDETEIPADRTFRDGWKCERGRIEHDMTRCREIHRRRMRDERGPKLAALDIEYQRADEAGDAAAKKDIARRKQALRDVTAHPAIEAASTPDELKAVWPDALK